MKIMVNLIIIYLLIIFFKFVSSIDLNLLYLLREYFNSDEILLIVNSNNAEKLSTLKEISKNTWVGFLNVNKNHSEFFQKKNKFKNSLFVSDNEISVIKNIIKQHHHIPNFWTSKTWVNFIYEDIKSHLDDLEIPWNSKFLSVNFSDHQIIDVYQIGRNTEKIYSDFAKWNESKLEIRHQDFYRPRMDLKGYQLKIIESTDKDFSREWILLSEAMNFNISWIEYTGGALYANGTKVGIFKKIYDRDIDGSSSNLVYNSLRLDYFDYIFPAHISHTKMYVAMMHTLNWTSFIAPFDKNVWICIVAWTVLASSVLFVVQKCQKNIVSRSENSIFVVLKAFCYQGGEINGSSTSIYISYLMPFILSAVLIQYYSALLLSSLTLQKSFTPFKNLQEVAKDATYKIIVQNTSYINFYLSTDTGYEANIIRNGLLIAVPNERLEFPNLCFKRQIVICGTLGAVIKAPCDVAEIQDPIFYETSGILVWKGFPYKDMMIKLLKRLQFSGLVKLRKKNSIIPDESLESLKALSLETVFPIFLLYISLLIIVLVIILMEIIINKNKNKK